MLVGSFEPPCKESVVDSHLLVDERRKSSETSQQTMNRLFNKHIH